MRTNQKYFACTGGGRRARAQFRLHRQYRGDRTAARRSSPATRKVLAARLSDAKFFWEQDLQGAAREQAAKLDQIVFHEKLGTVADKVERVAKLARWLVERGHRQAAKRESPRAGQLVETAARLAKADLVTGMVGEFPELQGMIGGYLARAQGHARAVADAIRDHYKPVGQGDEVPTAPVTVAVSLADKLDTLVALLRDRREADRLEGSLRTAPRRARRPQL